MSDVAWTRQPSRGSTRLTARRHEGRQQNRDGGPVAATPPCSPTSSRQGERPIDGPHSAILSPLTRSSDHLLVILGGHRGNVGKSDMRSLEQARPTDRAGPSKATRRDGCDTVAALERSMAIAVDDARAARALFAEVTAGATHGRKRNGMASRLGLAVARVLGLRGTPGADTIARGHAIQSISWARSATRAVTTRTV